MKEIISAHKERIKAIIKKLTGSYNDDIEQEVILKPGRTLTIIVKKASSANG